MAAGISSTPLTHDEVQAAAAKAAPLFKKLVTDSSGAVIQETCDRQYHEDGEAVICRNNRICKL